MVSETATKPLILLSNDDGVEAPGIRAAQEALTPLAEVMVVAPDRERSASSHSISLDRPLRIDEVRAGVFAIDGTPVDCMYLALLHLAPRRPALCVSGINHGYNLGSDIFYSGTVAAAVEGVLRGVPGIAISLERRRQQDFAPAVAFLRALVAEFLVQGEGDKTSLPSATFLNVNVPSGTPRGYEITALGKRVYRDMVDVRQDLRGRSYYWIGGPEEDATDVPGSDCRAVRAGFVSVSPVTLDLTHRSQIDELKRWRIGGFVQGDGESSAGPNDQSR